MFSMLWTWQEISRNASISGERDQIGRSVPAMQSSATTRHPAVLGGVLKLVPLSPRGYLAGAGRLSSWAGTSALIGRGDPSRSVCKLGRNLKVVFPTTAV